MRAPLVLALVTVVASGAARADELYPPPPPLDGAADPDGARPAVPSPLDDDAVTASSADPDAVDAGADDDGADDDGAEDDDGAPAEARPLPPADAAVVDDDLDAAAPAAPGHRASPDVDGGLRFTGASVGAMIGAGAPGCAGVGGAALLAGFGLTVITNGLAQGGCGGVVGVVVGLVIVLAAAPLLAVVAVVVPVVAIIGALVGAALDDDASLLAAAGATAGFVPALLSIVGIGGGIAAVYVTSALNNGVAPDWASYLLVGAFGVAAVAAVATIPASILGVVVVDQATGPLPPDVATE